MRRNGLTAKALANQLHERGIEKSLSQVYRLMATPPTTASLIAALCEVLHCAPNDLISITGSAADPDLPPDFELYEPR